MNPAMDLRDAGPGRPPATDRAATEGITRFDRAFARAAGAAPTDGNAVRLLLDASENYPAWLAEIRAARRYVLFESYLVADDRVGHAFAEALVAKVREGVRVCVVYDWFGCLPARWFWSMLRDAGAQVLGFNPPRLDSPFAWLTRDHRKSIVVDGEVAFVSGLCVSAEWEGDPGKRLQPWRDTGVEIRGPAVAEVEAAFVQTWAASGGERLELPPAPTQTPPGKVRVRVIAGAPGATGTYRNDLLIASVARKRLWLTDAYFVAGAAFTQALRAAAQDGVDVRLLVPGSSDIPPISPLSRSGYRTLLDAGVRVFEWNGTMLHAKTAVADDLWSRVGSTNLNMASWLSNYELDVAIEDREFTLRMAAQYERDLCNATEIVLTRHNRVRRAESRTAAAACEGAEVARRALSGSAGRAAAGAASVGSALGAALTNRRMLGPPESGMLIATAALTLILAIVAVLYPRIVAWPIGALGAWLGLAWAWKGFGLWRQARSGRRAAPKPNAEGPRESGKADD